MKLILLCLTILFTLQLADGLTCKQCTSEDEYCQKISKENDIPSDACISGPDESCYEMNYFDKESQKNMTERDCGHMFIEEDEDENSNICQYFKEKLEESNEGKMHNCTVCYTDDCNNTDF